MILRSLPRRALAVASSALLGLLSAVALMPGPAGAQTSAVQGSCAWDADTQQWIVTWTVTSNPPAGTESYRLASVEVTPSGSTVEYIEPSPAGSFPFDADDPLVGVQRLPEGASAASLTVRAEWDNLQQDAQAQRGEVAIPTDCGTPGLLSQWSLECDAVVITIHNPTTETVALILAPNTGNSVEVQVAGGRDATVEFPPSEGLAVDILLDGRSIVDQADPIQVTPEQLANLECEEDDGGGGGLPATGTSALIVAAGALTLLALGTGLYLLARRRRIRFTA